MPEACWTLAKNNVLAVEVLPFKFKFAPVSIVRAPSIVAFPLSVVVPDTMVRLLKLVKKVVGRVLTAVSSIVAPFAVASGVHVPDDRQ